jgi:hypothetical protein
MCSGHMLGGWEEVSEQEKVGGITSYEGLCIFFVLLASLDGLTSTSCLRPFWGVGNTAHAVG